MISAYQRYVLNNGLKLILVPDDSRQVVTTMVLFGVGSRYEEESEAGISHVLEHMFYKGTKKRPSSLELSEFVDEIGGEHNAFTAKEYTGYYTKVSYKHLDKSIDFLSDLLVNPLFLQEELDKEKNVILQEYDMYEDLPMEVVSSRFERTLFGKNSLGRDVIGYKDRIKAVKSEDLFRYKDSHYVGENCAIVIVGNFGAYTNKQIVEMVESNFTFKSGSRSKIVPVEFDKSIKVSIEKKKTEQSHLIIGFRGSSYDNLDRYKLRLLSIILGGSMSSRLFMEIREKRGLAYAIRTSNSSYLDTGAFETYAGVPNDKTIEAIEAIISEYRKIKEAVTKQELAKAKEIISGRMLISFEDTNDVANHFALSEILFGKIMTPKEMMSIYQKITVEDLLEVAEKYLNNESLTLSFVGKDFLEYNIKNILKI